jgi:hypothetical protein
MQEEKSRAESITPTKEEAAKDATSKETVSDLEGSSKASGSDAGANSGGAGSSSTPSPDGQFDSPREGSGTGDETGPM